MNKNTAVRNASQDEVQQQHAQIGIRRNVSPGTFSRTTHPDAQWFPEAGLGLFLHWGLSSVLGQGDLSWSMMQGRFSNQETITRYGLAAVQIPITPDRYWAQAEKFTADRFDPDRILSAAKHAGFKYAVLTTKHHDGFALWPSRFGDFNVGQYLKGRDLVGEFVAACRACGLKVGFYYSPPDWHYQRQYMSFRYGNQKPALGVNHEPVELPVLGPEQQAQWDAGFRTYLHGQIEELLTHYGQVDVMWFDGHGQDAITTERIRELQPGIVVNPRAHGYGDFDSAECEFPNQRFPGWWEYCHVFSDGAWGYLDHEIYKPLGWFLSEFAKARGWGGNFLPNVGPDSHGELPEVFYKRMAQLKRWMAHSAVSMFGTSPGSWPERANVPVTCRGNTWYAHADWIFKGTIELRDVDRPDSVHLLRTGKTVPFRFEDRRFTTDIPLEAKTNLDDVVEIRWNP